MKTKFNYIIMLCMGLFALTACTSDVDDVFDKSAPERMDETIAAQKSILESAPYGWRAEYYGDTSYGGYNVFMKFEGDNVTVASEQVGASHKAGIGEDGSLITCTTHYKFEQSQGSVISFDDYNYVFHYFSDPGIEDFGMKGEAFYGDLEFRVLEACKDSVIMTGKKHGVTIRMYPVESKENVQDYKELWAQYIIDVRDTYEFMASRSYTLQDTDKKTEDGKNAVLASIYTNWRSMIFSHYDDEGKMVQTSAPFIITPEGFKFYRPVTIQGVTISFVEKNRSGNPADLTQDYFYLKGNSENIKIFTYLPPLYESLETGMWFLTYENNDIGDFAKPYWEKFREGLKTAGPGKTKNRLIWAFIGTYSSDKQGLHLQAGDDYVFWGMKFTPENEEGDEVTLTSNSATSNAAGKNYYKKHKLNEALIPFCGTGSTGRTFTIKADDKRNPTYLILTDKNEPTNVIKLYAAQKLYPFGDLDADDKK